ncbi:hypothetical protein GM418_12655 [Maribellus comscasis]|uniref:Uncharacterized protein n=1 Tax=Maribellus comscasis TaxID=2681766 RepID=A0A6I6JTW1_9BACT|nr:hypothetical protein [Maribellus comscasis]QGY44478.1 hypothetical protein GM418_12655 [Maribellus comscasis]
MRISFVLLLLLLSCSAYSQSRSTKEWINFGSSHISKWIQVAPGKLGPNALPVPEMDYAEIGTQSEFEAGIHSHFMKGDTAVNSYLAFQWTVVPEKVAFKLWGFPTETFRMNNEIRDERQIFYDDKGWQTSGGDLWISTFIQLMKNRGNWPDLVLNYSMKTTTGSILHARYTDGMAHYFYLSLGKSFYPNNSFFDEIRLAAMGGFYEWQTNKVEMAQDEGPLFEAGIKVKHNSFVLANEIGGYFAYGAYHFMGVKGYNNPIIYRLRLIKEGKKMDWKLEYKTGWQDYNYTTFKIEVAYHFTI